MKRIINVINKLLDEKENVVIAIDGMCASGKSTLASEIAGIIDCNIIHLDDFFLPINLRNKERLKEVGGNIDYVRFKEEVIDKLDSNFEYKRFDCKSNQFKDLVTIHKKRVTIIEGAYSLHPYFGKYYDYSVFLKIDSSEQLKRIEKRNGKDRVKEFKDKWIVLENKYFDFYFIENKADMVISFTK